MHEHAHYVGGCINCFLLLNFPHSLSFNIFFTSEPYVTEDELKLMLRGAELSGAIEEEEQVLLMIFFLL